MIMAVQEITWYIGDFFLISDSLNLRIAQQGSREGSSLQKNEILTLLKYFCISCRVIVQSD
jgi:hypothetical protein